MPKNQNKNNRPFYKIARDLLRTKIQDIDDVKKFYIGVNNLASQISSDYVFISELSSPKYNDNLKLLEAVNYVLGYGQAAGRSGLFAKKSLKKVYLSYFLEENPGAMIEIKNVQKEAGLYFDVIKKAVDGYSKEEVDKIVEDLEKKFEKLEEKIEELKKIIMSPSAEEEIKIGPLIYKDYSIFYNNSRLELMPQLVKLCKLFIERGKKKEPFISDESIREVITKNKYLSDESLEKLVSKLRRAIVRKDGLIKIKRVSDKGYNFTAK